MGFFKNAGKKILGGMQRLGNMKPESLGKIPIIGGILEQAAKGGTALGEGIREKDLKKVLTGVKDSGSALARGAALPGTFLGEEAMRGKK
jgi:hypothetical protein